MTLIVPKSNVTFYDPGLPATDEAPVEFDFPALPANPYSLGRALGERLASISSFADLERVAEALTVDRPSLAAGLVRGLRNVLDAVDDGDAVLLSYVAPPEE